MPRPKDTTRDPILARVRALVEPILVAHGVELVDALWATEHGGRALRITIERRPEVPAGEPGAPDAGWSSGWGVTLEDCSEVSRDISSALDVEDFIPGSYALEVSSPGLDRPLVRCDEFARFRGLEAKVKLAQPAPDGQRVLRGRIVEVAGSIVTMEVDNKSISFEHENVAEAHLVFSLEKTPKKGSPKNPKKKGPQAGSARPLASSGPRSPGHRSES